ncbi:unnamed protein product [Bursaphelenchus okinawaensis]|uniref:Uncharacterized protein n=1 Tax=Bursaphelenchus okinawaensis TaxID=465554 RepID=A0A811LI31_9BILA|nr:unnamed protein product [Bursaphelenchus okinawaensis]CAG9126091.1 unnamed protein product [Bursaphelenchus okinawaensis]
MVRSSTGKEVVIKVDWNNLDSLTTNIEDAVRVTKADPQTFCINLECNPKNTIICFKSLPKQLISPAYRDAMIECALDTVQPGRASPCHVQYLPFRLKKRHQMKIIQQSSF